MNHKSLSSVLGLAAVLASTSVFACGQMAPVGPTKPGAKISLRGYGFGFEGGARPVSLVWSTGEAAGAASIDAKGEFVVEITAPGQAGEYNLIVREGDSDPSPTVVTVPVTGAGT